MRILEKCPICGGEILKAKLGVINQLHGAKLVFEDQNQEPRRLSKIGFGKLYIDHVYFCSKCEMFVGFTNKREDDDKE